MKELERLGIGRPSTYAAIISTITDREYVKLEQKRFEPTPLGETVAAVLIKIFPDLCSVGFTSGMEAELDRIEEGDAAWLPEASLERNELVGTLRSAIARLPEMPRRVLMEHHFEGRLLRDIAEDLGVTEARASQLRHEALHALQAYFGTAYDQVPAVPENAPGKRARVAFVATVQADTTWRSRLAGAGAVEEPVAASA